MTGRSQAALAVALLVASIAASFAQSPAANGRYLATIAACTGCHTPRAPGAALLSGGTRFGGGPSAAIAANLTPDRETGLGTWTDAQIAKAIRDGIRPDGTRIGPPMPQRPYHGLTDTDIAAIIAFLRSVPAVHKLIEHRERSRKDGEDATKAAAGEQRANGSDARGRYLFTAVAHCAECHRPGKTSGSGPGGSVRSFPGPDGPVVAPILTPDAVAGFPDPALAEIITHGTRPDGSRLKGPMPVAAYAHLTPEDLAAIIAYLRVPKR